MRLSETIIDRNTLCKLTSSKLASGEVTEWFMVPLSKSGGQKCLVGSNPTLSAERCWSGLTGTPGERVSGFPTVGSNPTLSATNGAESEGGFRTGFIRF